MFLLFISLLHSNTCLCSGPTGHSALLLGDSIWPQRLTEHGHAETQLIPPAQTCCLSFRLISNCLFNISAWMCSNLLELGNLIKFEMEFSVTLFPKHFISASRLSPALPFPISVSSALVHCSEVWESYLIHLPFLSCTSCSKAHSAPAFKMQL